MCERFFTAIKGYRELNFSLSSLTSIISKGFHKCTLQTNSERNSMQAEQGKTNVVFARWI